MIPFRKICSTKRWTIKQKPAPKEPIVSLFWKRQNQDGSLWLQTPIAWVFKPTFWFQSIIIITKAGDYINIMSRIMHCLYLFIVHYMRVIHVCISVLSIVWSVCLSDTLSLSTSLPFCLSAWLSLCLSSCLSICMPVYLPPVCMYIIFLLLFWFALL